ncbi:MAG TPA: threonine ammonia-lyase [Solirubrobacteraceae bacterium]|nr:threonine ammonia-lyase [Solirubrobacteraceae bacterium]
MAPETGADGLITEASIERAARAGDGVVRETPIITTRTLSERAGARIVLKAENLQGTGSFKLRGAMAKIAALGEETARGVVCGSAGNHAQAVAYAALSRGVPCEVFMPEAAPIAKADAVQSLGATLHLEGRSVDDSVAAAKARAAEAGMQFIHPFDDPDVISGQGGVGLELLRQVPDLARVIVPVGGGGLISGIAIAIRSQRPEVEIIGVQVEACSPFLASLQAGQPVAVDSARTIADGIAVKRPGDITLRLIDRWVNDMVVVAEDQVAEAMVFMMERSKLVVEGAGAVGVAALLAGRLPPAAGDGTTVLVLSGGNVGAGMLAEVARRHETQARRRLVLRVRIPDLPGSLAALLGTVSRTGANLLDVQHIREGLDLHIQETAVQLVLETRGAEHATAVRAAIEAGGYQEATEIL